MTTKPALQKILKGMLHRRGRKKYTITNLEKE
jgi:hypothetical protein